MSEPMRDLLGVSISKLPYVSANGTLVMSVEKISDLLPRLVAMLKRLEWGGADEGERYCKVCPNDIEGEHDPDCELASLLKECEG